MSFLHVEKLWKNGPVRKLYYNRQFDVLYEGMVAHGIAPVEAKELSHLEVHQALYELFGCTREELYSLGPVEVLSIIQPYGAGMFNGYKITIDPPDKYARGYIEGRNIALFEAANLNYNGKEFIPLDRNVNHELKEIKVRAL